jgi:hypothetical protein
MASYNLSSEESLRIHLQQVKTWPLIWGAEGLFLADITPRDQKVN